MLTEDLQPWLIEINSSPSMARTTRVTADLVDGVLEDTVRGSRPVAILLVVVTVWELRGVRRPLDVFNPLVTC